MQKLSELGGARSRCGADPSSSQRCVRHNVAQQLLPLRRRDQVTGERDARDTAVGIKSAIKPQTTTTQWAPLLIIWPLNSQTPG